MKTIKFFHPEETFIYHIEKSLCKVVYQDNRNYLLIEIHSNDDLEHVEEDSLQNEFPQISLFIDDFPLTIKSLEQLNGNNLEIPFSYVEEDDEEGDTNEYHYTNLSIPDGDFEVDANHLEFFTNNQGVFSLKWKGEVDDFTGSTDEKITIEVNCAFQNKKIEDLLV